MANRIVEKIVIFRAPRMAGSDYYVWHFLDASMPEFCWLIRNPSGELYADRAFMGMGEMRVITPEQAQGVKRETLINCAKYSARVVLPKYGETINDDTIFVIKD